MHLLQMTPSRCPWQPWSQCLIFVNVICGSSIDGRPFLGLPFSYFFWLWGSMFQRMAFLPSKIGTTPSHQSFWMAWSWLGNPWTLAWVTSNLTVSCQHLVNLVLCSDVNLHIAVCGMSQCLLTFCGNLDDAVLKRPKNSASPGLLKNQLNSQQQQQE